MSNDLTTAGAGAVVPAGSGGAAVGEHVGDVSTDRGSAQSPPVASEGLLREVQKAVGFDVSVEQVQKAGEVLQRHRTAMDTEQKLAVDTKLSAEWGRHGYKERVGRIIEWLTTLPGNLGEEIRNARDSNGDALANKPAVLRAMHEVAAATILTTDDERDRGIAVRTLKAEWKGAYISHISTIKRFLENSVPRSIREGLLNARDDNDVAVTNDPDALRWLLHLARPRLEMPRSVPAVDQSAIASTRRRELEAMMSDRNSLYWKDDAVQREYRELIGQGARSDVVPHTASSDVERRIAEIEKWMGAHKGSSEYKRYWDDPAVQREYGELLERRERALR